MRVPLLDVALAGTRGHFRLDMAFRLPARGIIGLIGPSGAGKTTVLRAIAGLERLSGHIRLGEEVWQEGRHFRPPHTRAIGYVFQEASLFTHRTVRQNLLYAARRASTGEDDAAPDIAEAVAMMGLADMLDRKPATLSGGERQRVAIARALLTRPRLLLLDEPLSALDAAARVDIFPYLERLTRHAGVPGLYVSHDRDEIDRLADQLVLLHQGRTTASGPLPVLQTDPDLSLINRPDAAVTLEGRLHAIDEAYHLAAIDVDGARLFVPAPSGHVTPHYRLRIKARDVSITLDRPAATSILNCVPVCIRDSVTGPATSPYVTMTANLGEAGDGATILSQITRRSCDKLKLRAGLPAYAQIKSIALF